MTSSLDLPQLKKGLTLAVVAIAVAMTASSADKRAIPWERVADAPLRAELDRLVGSDAIDCGVVDIRKRKAADLVKQQSLDCIADAQQRGMPFKFGIVRLPLGRVAYEVYARTRNGQSWLLSHGQNPSEEVASSWMERCQFIEVSTRTLLISGMDCSEGRLIGEAE